MGNDSSKVPIIGIDLGTEYCCVASFENENVKIIPNFRKNLTTPSYVAFTDKGRLFGEEAKEQAHNNPTNTVYDVKRLMGRRFDDPKLTFDIDNHWPFKVVNENGKPKIEVVENGETKSYFPEQITAFLIGYLKKIAQHYLSGLEVTQAIVSVPAYFDDIQRQITLDACGLAGLKVLQLISEPTAASLAYIHNDFVLPKGFISKGLVRQHTLLFDLGGGTLDLSRQEFFFPKGFSSKGLVRQNTLVFDLGGGTLDLSRQEFFFGEVKVLGKSGDTRLGGNDFDKRILYHFLSEIQQICDTDFEKDKVAIYLLTVESEKAKQHLTFNESYENEFEYKEFNLNLRLTREKFEELCEDLFDEIRKRLSSFLKYGTTKFPIVYHPLFDENFTNELDPSETIRRKIKDAKKIRSHLKNLESNHFSMIKIEHSFDSAHEQTLRCLNIVQKEMFELLQTIEKDLSENKEYKLKLNDYSNNETIDFVILVGGSSKIPKIKSILNEFFNERQLISEIDPKEAVAYGAAIQAAILSRVNIGIKLVPMSVDDNVDLRFNDCLPFSVGIEDFDGNMDIFIKRNSKLPIEASKVYMQNLKVDYDHKKIPSILIKVYEGEEKVATKNLFIGQLGLKNFKIPYQIEISIQINSSNIITLKLKDISPRGWLESISPRGWLESGLEVSKTLNNTAGRLTNDEINNLMNEQETKLFLDENRLYSDSSNNMLKYRELLELFEKSLIKPMDGNILDKLNNGLKKPGDKVVISFEFPFMGCSSKVEHVELVNIFNSQAKPKLLRCQPMNRNIIFKTGDNLYDDQIIMSFLNVFNAIWQHSNLNFTWTRSTGNLSHSSNQLIFNKCYTIIPMGETRAKSGLIECIGGESAEDMWNRNYFLRSPQHKYNDVANSLRPGGGDYTKLMASAIGTFVSMYVLGIGDRHQGNMMVANDNTFFNIDFGFTFGETPFIDTADFPIPFFLYDYIKTNNEWDNFRDKMWQARNALIEYNDLIEYLAIKFIQDPLKLTKVKNTFRRTLNKSMSKYWFKFKLGAGRYLKLPKDVIHSQAIRNNSQRPVETNSSSSTQTS